MVTVESFYNTLKEMGVSLFAGVPDSLLKDLCAFISDNTDSRHNIITANEGSAIGIAAGHYLSTNKVPLVYMQNSGLGNAINPLISLADEKVYSLPILLVIGWRGEPNIHDEPQHIKQGEITLSLLDSLQIPYTILSDNNEEANTQLQKAIINCKKLSKPHAIIIRKNTFNNYSLKNKAQNSYTISREDALKKMLTILNSDDLIVSTTGKLSRELFELRESLNENHSRDFLTVGSMGHSSSIALGIALEKPDRRVFCFDGDGAFIMHMGAISNIGNLAPKNFIHIVFNNGAHESVGSQPTLGFNIDICDIAKACGYKGAISISTNEDFNTLAQQMPTFIGPFLIEIRVCINSRKDLGRPTTTPIENRDSFMNNINR